MTTVSAPRQTPLNRLFEFLLYLGFSAENLPAGPDLNFENVLVVLDEEPLEESPELDPEQQSEQKEARYVAQLFFTEDVLQGPELPDIKDELERAATLQFLVNMPLQLTSLNPERLLEAHELLMICSQIIPVGYFGINHEKQVYLSYALKAQSQDIPVPLIVEILEQMSFFIHRLLPWVEALNNSETPLKELITSMEKSLMIFAQPDSV